MDIKQFSANGVPYPLDDYLKLIGKPTTFEIAEVVKRWGKSSKSKDIEFKKISEDK